MSDEPFSGPSTFPYGLTADEWQHRIRSIPVGREIPKTPLGVIRAFVEEQKDPISTLRYHDSVKKIDLNARITWPEVYAALAELEQFLFHPVDSPQSNRLLVAIRDIFPHQGVIDCAGTPSGTPALTCGLGYEIGREMEQDGVAPTIEAACKKIGDSFLRLFYRQFGKEPRSEVFFWREKPNFIYWFDREFRSKKIALWMRFAIEPSPELNSHITFYLEEGETIEYIREAAN